MDLGFQKHTRACQFTCTHRVGIPTRVQRNYWSILSNPGTCMYTVLAHEGFLKIADGAMKSILGTPSSNHSRNSHRLRSAHAVTVKSHPSASKIPGYSRLFTTGLSCFQQDSGEESTRTW
eukprot:99571-Rhodomonas_salina.1